MSLILTKAALALKNPEEKFEVVKFESYKPKKKAELNNDSTENEKQKQLPSKVLELKTIRHEVVKFGITGFDPSKKEEAKIALAVSLGAKPPKGKYINYKELIQKRKEEKLKEKEQKQQMISKTVLQRSGHKKKRSNNDVGHFLSGYGKVQKKDLKKDDKVTKKKRKK